MTTEIHDYSDEQVEPDENEIKRLGRLVVKLAELMLEEQEADENLKRIQKERRQYEQNLIPELMEQIGMSEVTTMGGMKVTCKDVIRVSFPKDPEKVQRAFAWLRETGNDGIIKRQFTIQYGRGDGAWAEKFNELLAEQEVEEHAHVEQTKTIHPTTLKSFLEKELVKGTDPPLEDFGAFQQKFAKIKLPK